MDTEYLAHREWLGYVQPVGLVVSIPALLAAQAHLNRHIAPEQQRFLACLPRERSDDVIPEIRDFAEFTQTVLEWEPADLVALPEVVTLPEDLAALEVVLPEYHETLRPTYGVREFVPKTGQAPWLLLIQCLPTGTTLDAPTAASDRHWHASPQAKFERLLRETGVPIGVLCNGTHLRLVYAPRGETSGYMTFSVAEMAQVAGRPIFAGLHLLLAAERLFSLAEKQRLPALLAESRKYQNTVSTQLAEQVLAALYELVRGLQAADDQRQGALLRDVLAAHPHQVYAGLLTVLMRLVFILYAEDRGLLPSDPLYANSYAVTGLFERLRADAARFPDTMDLRYGAWAQLLTLFRLIYDGGGHGAMRLPARQGYLFDPDRYPFLEGRPHGTRRGQDVTCELPHIADGVICRVLSNLLILDGERLSYRSLDVEQIGSVYEAVMGFHLEVASGCSIALKPAKAQGAPTTINLEALLATRPQDRAKWLVEQTDQKLTGQAADALKSATSLEELLAALERRIARHVTPHVVPAGSMVLQPSDERRRSGSHYTPRALTAPIVRTTLQPILARLGEAPTPRQILDLAVCDPAMGSGAFLVEVCRLLGDELVKAWHVHNEVLVIPPDEDEVLHARRLVAQHCLYGVDKNPMAVDLAKLSLWLVTLARDHPFTFLDHSLRCGDALVGLTQEQILRFHWRPLARDTAHISARKQVPRRSAASDHAQQIEIPTAMIAARIHNATASRQRILAARDDRPYAQLQTELGNADDALSPVRLAGDLVIAAFFAANKEAQRNTQRDTWAWQLASYLGPSGRLDEWLPLDAAVAALRTAAQPIAPFHWEIEFPEVFGRENGGFDAMVGNPPFAGGRKVRGFLGDAYFDWLGALHEASHGNADLVAHFYRRAFSLLRQGGCFGLIATNTISQGDTRATGLRWICTHGGSIFAARRRYRWPGAAAVVVSVVHVCRGQARGPAHLDGREAPQITAYLFHTGGHDDPARLQANADKSFIGSYVLGMGFTFDDTDTSGVANPLWRMRELIAQNPRNAERIFPYIGGEEVNSSPTHAPHRYAINFGDMSEEEARQWPELMRIVEEKVKPTRLQVNRASYRNRWWQYAEKQLSLSNTIRGLERVLVCSRIGNAFAFTFLPRGIVMNEKLVIFPFSQTAVFSVIQSHVHEAWARFFSSTLKDDLQYTPSDCFETFPFPKNFETDTHLEAIGAAYYDFRAQLMIANNEGLTKTYNRFHDPHERSPAINKLRELHDAMDRAVLDAYGWTDLTPTCEFLLDYDEDEDDEANTSRRKAPWRYRWPDDIRDEVLARLLALNAQRAEAERLAGLTAHAATGMSQRRKKPSSDTASRRQRAMPNTDQPDLLGRSTRLLDA